MKRLRGRTLPGRPVQCGTTGRRLNNNGASTVHPVSPSLAGVQLPSETEAALRVLLRDFPLSANLTVPKDSVDAARTLHQARVSSDVFGGASGGGASGAGAGASGAGAGAGASGAGVVHEWASRGSGDDSDPDTVAGPLPPATTKPRLLAGSSTTVVYRNIAPFGVALKSQLHAMVKDRTAVDTFLAQGVAAGRLRVLKLGTGPHDVAVCRADAYQAYVYTLAGAAKGVRREAFRRLHAALPRLRGLAVTRAVLHGELSRTGEDALTRSATAPLSTAKRRRSCAGGGRGSDSDGEARRTRLGISASMPPPDALTHDASALIRALVVAGFFVRKDDGDGAGFWFTLPQARLLQECVDKGRTELVRILRRRKYNEMPQPEMEKRGLRLTPLPVPFHVRDAVGAGVVKLLVRDGGQRFLRLP